MHRDVCGLVTNSVVSMDYVIVSRLMTFSYNLRRLGKTRQPDGWEEGSRRRAPLFAVHKAAFDSLIYDSMRRTAAAVSCVRTENHSYLH